MSQRRIYTIVNFAIPTEIGLKLAVTRREVGSGSTIANERLWSTSSFRGRLNERCKKRAVCEISTAVASQWRLCFWLATDNHQLLKWCFSERNFSASRIRANHAGCREQNIIYIYICPYSLYRLLCLNISSWIRWSYPLNRPFSILWEKTLHLLQMKARIIRSLSLLTPHNSPIHTSCPK